MGHQEPLQNDKFEMQLRSPMTQKTERMGEKTTVYARHL
jgi:hypothetical protein